MSAVTDHGFEGYKFVPAGVHMFVWRAGEEDMGVRNVFLHRCEQGDVVLRKYDAQKDAWTTEPRLVVSHDHLKTFDSHLAAYPFAQLPQWQSLTRHLGASKDTFDRLAGEYDSFAYVAEGPQSLKLTQFDIKRSWPPDATGANRTQWSMDKSWLLDRVMRDAASGSNAEHVALLAEFELCFVLALYANNVSALEHWAAIRTLFCRAATRMGAPSYYSLHPCEWQGDTPTLAPPSLDAHIAFLDTLAAQLQCLPDDAWTDQLAEYEAGILDDFVHLQRTIGRALGAWAASSRMRDERVAEPRFAELIAAWRTLASTGRRWGWQLGAELDEEAEAASEDDEDAPVVVY
ncbi:hypothetical protein MCUN1_002105 [Malassezia cuniculi]|uniref:Uncharacterized protein n=1 Tax=Malassezia cuniculi TaxID=948313 RepID=A0AAF0EVF1_9BASI|nr:hypothetical protein MCUN1_002105 [Malassezia cuniculi]